MGIRIIKDGQVVQETPKSPLELRIEHLERVIVDLTNQIKDLKRDGKKTNKKTSVR
jgi:hypothetical protein